MQRAEPKKRKNPHNLAVLFSAVAKKVLLESLRIKGGESITIETWNTGLDFARELTVEARRIGAIPILLFEDEESYIAGVRSSPPDFLGRMGKHEEALLSNTDCYVFIPGPPIGLYSRSLTSEEKSKSTAYNASWYEQAEKAKLRGARLSFGYIGQDYSRLLKKPIKDIVAHQFNASLVDFQEIQATGKRLAVQLSDGAEAKLSSGERDSSLAFKFNGELSIEDGIVDQDDVGKGENIAYIPPGFISKQVDPSSASGKIRIGTSITRLGMISDAELEFKEGKLEGYKTKSSASSKIIEALLADSSSKNLTLLTIGLNPKMKYGYGQDRFVLGAVGLAGFGFSCFVRSPNLSVTGTSLVEKGKLVA